MLAAAMVAVLVSLTAGGAYLGAAVRARHAAQATADLAALAAAAALPGGAQAACARATRVVDRMAAQAAGCVVRGLDVVVTVEVPVAGVGWARAAARAGPAA
ncbi:Rv3654c family TadE-like protein [Mycobacterium talmoniae]|uniref:Helicase n=1 Tax=Mycobacterium talmoniae TaxID=1858794 RepID=A0A1S1NDY4_9MYCO|nr:MULTISPECIES: Rv3654c family TadE-like protein [Mycobacterium]OHU98172.1 helicase [Mycobacterium talmoniae]